MHHGLHLSLKVITESQSPKSKIDGLLSVCLYSMWVELVMQRSANIISQCAFWAMLQVDSSRNHVFVDQASFTKFSRTLFNDVQA